jgi:dihydroflavonol-4-reductase
MKRCAVTGANGFVGSNVVRQLLHAGYEVVAIVGRDLDLENLAGLPVKVHEMDVLDRSSVRRAIDGASLLVHAAACYSFWTSDDTLPYRVNVDGTRNVLREAREAGCEKVVYTSSTATLSPGFLAEPDANAESDEDAVLDLRRFRGHYKMSKAMAEVVALREAARGLPLVILHPTTVLGPGDRRPTPTGSIIVHFLAGHMKAYVETAQNLVDVEDVALGHLRALEHAAPGSRYILGGDNLSMRELLDTLAELTGMSAPRIALPKLLMRGLAHGNGWWSQHVTGREPLIPLEAILHAADSRPVRNHRARTELGLTFRPAREVLERSLGWFAAQGHGSPAVRERLGVDAELDPGSSI